jgi:diaminopimelate epimerase
MGFNWNATAPFRNAPILILPCLQGDNLIRLDTWERGVGLTQACGTGACATAIAAITLGLCTPGAVTVRPPYNQDDNDADVLVIDYQPDTHLLMSGPVQFDFDGEAAA